MKPIELANKMIMSVSDQPEDPMDVLYASCLVLTKAICQLTDTKDLDGIHCLIVEKTTEILTKTVKGMDNLFKITEEILDLNFDWNVEGFWYYRKEVPFTWVRIYKDINAGDIGPLWRVVIDAHGDHLCRHLKNQPELLSAMRMMGLDDLADNFKIE